MKKKKTIFVFLALSLVLNVFLFSKARGNLWYIYLENSNLRDNYNTVHNVKNAQKTATGKGVKVGILGKYFGYENKKDLYAGGVDFVGDSEALNAIQEHGYWMAVTLKEIAPDVEVYALNARSSNKDKQTEGIVKAIDWAIENGIDILTYSDAPFEGEHRKKIDAAMAKGVRNNIVFTFIHDDNPINLFPDMLTLSDYGYYDRPSDVSIFHYDYNFISLDRYKRFKALTGKPTNGGDIPYFSISSMSPVLAGFVAMLKEVNNELSPSEYKKILVESSKVFDYNGRMIPKVVDAVKALEFIKVNY